MTSGDKFPNLYWQDLTEPGPMDQLNASKKVEATLTEKLGREPTPEEHDDAYKAALGELAVEVIGDQQREAVDAAKKIIEELTEFVNKYGESNE